MHADPLSTAVLETLLYADLFDQPLRPAALHRYLHGCAIDRPSLDVHLEDGLTSSVPVVRIDGYYLIRGREGVLENARAGEARFERIWPLAVRYGLAASRMPFVRMVAVTGGLAVRNAAENGDIDYLVATEPGRVWTSRLFVILLVRLAALRGITLCPNYFLALDALALLDRSIFTAHELAQMIPLTGKEIYGRMRAENAWADALLPNAGGPPFAHPSAPLKIGSPVERILAGSAGERMERWEMGRKIRKLGVSDGGSGDTDGGSRETVFDAARVQGHFQGYRARTLAAFEAAKNTYRI